MSDTKHGSRLQELFFMEGLKLVIVRHLKDNTIFFSALTNVDLRELLDIVKEWLSEVFVFIEPWSLEQIPANKVLWLRLIGVSLHV